MNRRAVWINVNESLRGSISRASVINYLNTMVDEGLLTYTEAACKGGHHRLYYIKYEEAEFEHHIADQIITKLLRISARKAMSYRY